VQRVKRFTMGRIFGLILDQLLHLTSSFVVPGLQIFSLVFTLALWMQFCCTTEALCQLGERTHQGDSMKEDIVLAGIFKVHFGIEVKKASFEQQPHFHGWQK